MMKLSSKPTRYRCCKILLLKCDWLTIVLKTFGTYLTSILKKGLKDKRVELSGAVELAFISLAILSDNFKTNEAESTYRPKCETFSFTGSNVFLLFEDSSSSSSLKFVKKYYFKSSVRHIQYTLIQQLEPIEYKYRME